MLSPAQAGLLIVIGIFVTYMIGKVLFAEITKISYEQSRRAILDDRVAQEQEQKEQEAKATRDEVKNELNQ